MAETQDAPDAYLRSSPTNALSRSECGYCGGVFISAKDQIERLETEHRRTCRTKAASDPPNIVSSPAPSAHSLRVSNGGHENGRPVGDYMTQPVGAPKIGEVVSIPEFAEALTIVGVDRERGVVALARVGWPKAAIIRDIPFDTLIYAWKRPQPLLTPTSR